LGARDAELIWNREDNARALFEKVFAGLHISALLFAPPAEPFRTVVDFLARTAPQGIVKPEDTETRTFLHDLPVVTSLTSAAIVQVLKNRKCAIVPAGELSLTGRSAPNRLS
jgi:hypothetical protein